MIWPALRPSLARRFNAWTQKGKPWPSLPNPTVANGTGWFSLSSHVWNGNEWVEKLKRRVRDQRRLLAISLPISLPISPTAK